MFKQLTTVASRIAPSITRVRGYHTDGNTASSLMVGLNQSAEQERIAAEKAKEQQKRDVAEYRLTAYVASDRTSLTPEEQKSLEQSRRNSAALENEAAIEARAYSRKEQSKDAQKPNSTVSGSESITSNLFVIVRNTGQSK